MLNRKIFILIFLLALTASFALAEEIQLKSGKTISARIIERTDKYIKVDIMGVGVTFFNDEIDNINGEKLFTSKEPIIREQAAIPQGAEKSSSEIFKQTSSGIVVITAQAVGGPTGGSGFIVDKSGVVVTNFHVAATAETIEIKLKDGRKFLVTGIIDFDKKLDLCTLKIDATDLVALPLGNSDTLELGDKILVIGAPMGLEYTMSDGIISGIREILGQKRLQFSAPVSKGNSGGPLLNIRGEVVGIVTSIQPGGQNLNFAIPINEAKKYIHTQVKMSVKEFSQTVGKNYHLIQAAAEAAFSGDIDSFLSYAQQAAMLEPEDSLAHSVLGFAYGQKGMLDEAIVELEKAVSLNPNDEIAHSNLGVAYMQKYRDNEAIAEFKKAISINPNDAMALDNLGQAYVLSGMVDEGIAYLKKSIDIDPNSCFAHSNLAKAYYKKGQFDLAIKHCNQAIKLGCKVDPNFLNALQPYRK